MTDRRFGYFAVDRSIFENPLLARPEWFWAWQWLIANAAWKPCGKRIGGRVADLKRGQLAITIRDLAKTWGWSKSNVEYFLGKLCAEEMVVRAAIRTKCRTNLGAKDSYPATLLTICNYDKFQGAMKSQYGGSRQRLSQALGQDSPELPGIANESAVETNKQFLTRESRVRVGEPKESDFKPKHLQVSRDGKWLWVDYGTAEWSDYSSDYQSVCGVVLKHERRIGGMGQWFYKSGAAGWPKRGRKRA